VGVSTGDFWSFVRISFVSACMRACVSACVCKCMHGCMGVGVHAWFVRAWVRNLCMRTVRTLNTYIYVTVYSNSLIVFNNIILCHNFKNRLFDVLVYIFPLSMPLPGPQPQPRSLSYSSYPASEPLQPPYESVLNLNCSQFFYWKYSYKWSIRCIQHINTIHVYIISDLTLFHAATY